MTKEVVNQGRRRFLTASTAIVGAAGVVTAAVPFIKSWQPSARSKAAGAPVVADISKVEPGQMLKVPWRGTPVFLVNRTDEQVATLSSSELKDRLKDPESKHTDQQPAYAQNETRSIKPQWLVLVGVCTHLGCTPEFKPKIGPEPFDQHWQSGFYCPCHKSRFDIAGRVFQGVPAPTNLVVPPYRFIDDDQIEIGVDPDKGAA